MNEIPLGASKDQLDTPALCVDLDAMESNISSLLEACQNRGVAWRPHAKCHKSQAVARKLVDAGAIGVTCAKLGEAEVIAEAGVKDLLIANMIVGQKKLARLVALRRVADPIVCVDHEDQVRPLSTAFADQPQPIRVLIEVDIGLARVGCAPGEPALQLAALVHQSPGLELAGVMGYEGHLLTLPDADEKQKRIAEALKVLTDCADAQRSAGLPCEIVSCGGTGSFFYSLQADGVTELQAGGAVFMDEFYRRQCQVDKFQNALFVAATVVSRPTPERAIIDAGRKTMHGDFSEPRVVGRDDLQVTQLSAEHGALKVDLEGPGVRIGDRLEIIPGYSDMTTVLHDRFFAFRGEHLEAIWRLDGRGLLH